MIKTSMGMCIQGLATSMHPLHCMLRSNAQGTAPTRVLCAMLSRGPLRQDIGVAWTLLAITTWAPEDVDERQLWGTWGVAFKNQNGWRKQGERSATPHDIALCIVNVYARQDSPGPRPQKLPEHAHPQSLAAPPSGVLSKHTTSTEQIHVTADMQVAGSCIISMLGPAPTTRHGSANAAVARSPSVLAASNDRLHKQAVHARTKHQIWVL